MQEPKRRETRRTHLDASAVPVERALLHRADALEDLLSGFEHPGSVEWYAILRISNEFRQLAEEIHWW